MWAALKPACGKMPRVREAKIGDEALEFHRAAG
jgi:hypothetical protein